MDLRNWEHFADTGSPVNGATVEARLASLTSPNVGAVVASTTTNADGMWTFAGLADVPHDIKVTYLTQTWWYKGLSRHSTSALFTEASPVLQYPLIRNGGLESWGTGIGPVALTTTPTCVADLWWATVGVGSSGSVTKETTTKASASDASAKLIFARVAGVAQLWYSVPAPLISALRGKEVWISVQLRQGVASNTRAFVADSAGGSYGSSSATTGAFVTLTSSRTIDAAATSITFGIEVAASDTVYLDNAAAQIGTTAPTFGPNVVDAYLANEYVTVDQTGTATGHSNTLQATLNAIVGRLKAISGATNWYDAVATALSDKVTKTGDTSMSGTFSGAADIQWGTNNTRSLASGSDLNSITRSGWYFVDNTVLNAPVAGNFWSLLHIQYPGSNHAAQIIFAASDLTTVHTRKNNTLTWSSWGPLWHASNDGSGSGLDADLLDGSHGAAYLARSNHTGTQTASTISDLATAVSGMAAASATTAGSATNAVNATNATNATTATTASTASNANNLGGIAASGFFQLGSGTTQTFTGPSGMQAIFGTGWGGNGMKVIGDFTATGTKSREATGRDGQAGLFHANETPVPYFEEYGRDQLLHGEAVVPIPQDFANYVDLTDYYVQVTAEDPAALYVAERTAEDFVVRSFAGDTEASFTWHLVARQGDMAHIERSLPRAGV